MTDHFPDHATDHVPTRDDQHDVAKNDQECSSLSTTSSGILLLNKELQRHFGREMNTIFRKGYISMNTRASVEEHLEMETPLQTARTETETLTQCGFSPAETVALLWLRQWYQTGGSDRVQIVRHLEFLKLLVLHGKIEL